ncbi:MAG: hypothetical protein LBT56_04610 [Prevotellaceae bacterium]|nr:hypothetical protein [Prevotellaceae bacterium]
MKQTVSQLANKHSVSKSTITRLLKKQKNDFQIPYNKEVIVLMDATYWGRNFGVIVFKDSLKNKFFGTNLLIKKRHFPTILKVLKHYNTGV